MPSERDSIASSILEVLANATNPMLGREIADNLHRSGIIVTKQSVNSVLYFELTNGKCVAQDDSYHWTATGQVYSSSAELPNGHGRRTGHADRGGAH